MKRKGENILSPLSMKIPIQRKLQASPSKEKKVGTKKDGNEQKDTSHSGKNESSHQNKGDTSSNSSESDQGPLGGKDQEVSSPKGKGKVHMARMLKSIRMVSNKETKTMAL
jgi:hypothetical protein